MFIQLLIGQYTDSFSHLSTFPQRIENHNVLVIPRKDDNCY